MAVKKPMLPVGIEDFERIVTENFWYADKTLFIRDLLDNQAYVRLFTRPRRFGKTLKSRPLFENLAIGREDGGAYLDKYLNAYPVINLSLKSRETGSRPCHPIPQGDANSALIASRLNSSGSKLTSSESISA